MMASDYPPLQVNIFTFPGRGLEEAAAVRDAFLEGLTQRAARQIVADEKRRAEAERREQAVVVSQSAVLQ